MKITSALFVSCKQMEIPILTTFIYYIFHVGISNILSTLIETKQKNLARFSPSSVGRILNAIPIEFSPRTK